MATLLAITVLLPLVGSLVLVLTPKLEAHTARLIGLAFALVTLALSLVMLFAFRAEVSGPQFAFMAADGRYGLGWIERPDIRFSLGLDGLSLWLFILTSLLVMTAIWVFLAVDHRARASVLRIYPGARDRIAGLVRQPGRRALLHLL